MNKNLRKFMSFFGLVESQDKIEWEKRDIEQRQKLQEGEEFEPPWIIAPNAEPWSVEWRQGGEYWMDEFWQPFWKKLPNDEKRKYLEKWLPPENWYSRLVCGDRIYESMGEFEWFKTQQRKLESGEEIEPPWVAFPCSYASFGWDSNETEQWKLEVWIPFWKKLSQSEKDGYLENWQPPNEEWLKLITVDWSGKLKKPDYWHENQKKDSEWNDYVTVPWRVFPNNSAIYEWEEGEREKWLQFVWLPYWNKLSDEKQDKYLEHIPSVDSEWIEILKNHKVRNLEKIKTMKHS
jgi:hypothetical protein